MSILPYSNCLTRTLSSKRLGLLWLNSKKWMSNTSKLTSASRQRRTNPEKKSFALCLAHHCSKFKGSDSRARLIGLRFDLTEILNGNLSTVRELKTIGSRFGRCFQNCQGTSSF